MNKLGAEVDKLRGGVAGGSILTGMLMLGMCVEIIVTKDMQGRNRRRVRSLESNFYLPSVNLLQVQLTRHCATRTGSSGRCSAQWANCPKSTSSSRSVCSSCGICRASRPRIRRW
ncbi:hypothetical protein DFH11DRAFT_1634552 [Phellopilus nigrolimitatus]|nr:hypothetical protein DFH11DRAFT_1634552 [Phellopilus nigrolimitatus]